VPIASRSDLIPGLVITVFDGAVTRAEWLDVMRRQVQDDDFIKAKRSLNDLTSATGLDRFSTDDLDRGVSFFEPHTAKMGHGRKMAVVANEGFDFAAIFEAKLRASSVPISGIVFVDLHTACMWLGVDTDQAREAIGRMRDELRAQ
jgi:hypothetical protein